MPPAALLKDPGPHRYKQQKIARGAQILVSSGRSLFELRLRARCPALRRGMALRCNGSLLLLLCMALLPLVVCEARTVKTMARSYDRSLTHKRVLSAAHTYHRAEKACVLLLVVTMSFRLTHGRFVPPRSLLVILPCNKLVLTPFAASPTQYVGSELVSPDGARCEHLRSLTAQQETQEAAPLGALNREQRDKSLRNYLA